MQFTCTHLDCPLEALRDPRTLTQEKQRRRNVREMRTQRVREQRANQAAMHEQRMIEELRVRQRPVRTKMDAGDAALKQKHALEVRERKSQVDRERKQFVDCEVGMKQRDRPRVPHGQLSQATLIRNAMLQEKSKQRRQNFVKMGQEEVQFNVKRSENNAKLRLENQNEREALQRQETKLKSKLGHEKVKIKRNILKKEERDVLKNTIALKEMRFNYLYKNTDDLPKHREEITKKIRARKENIVREVDKVPEDSLSDVLVVKSERIRSSFQPRPSLEVMELGQLKPELGWKDWEKQVRDHVIPEPRWYVRTQQALAVPAKKVEGTPKTSHRLDVEEASPKLLEVAEPMGSEDWSQWECKVRGKVKPDPRWMVRSLQGQALAIKRCLRQNDSNV